MISAFAICEAYTDSGGVITIIDSPTKHIHVKNCPNNAKKIREKKA